jgi:hypothetical protein
MQRRARLDVPGILHHVIICGIERRKLQPQAQMTWLVLSISVQVYYLPRGCLPKIAGTIYPFKPIEGKYCLVYIRTQQLSLQRKGVEK